MQTGVLVLVLASAGFCEAQLVAVSAANYQAPVAPASLVSLFGTNLSNQTTQAGLTPTTTLGDVSVQVGGQAAQLLYVSPGQVNLVMPAALASGTSEIVLQTSTGQTLRTNVEVRSTAPAVFSLDASGSGPGAILNAVTFTCGPFSVESDANLGDDKRTRLALFGTGIRYAGNTLLDPSVTNAAASVTAQASDAAGNIYTLPVEYAGAAPTFFGLDQVNVVLPPQLDGLGTLSLTVTAGGVSSNVVTINVTSLPAESIRLIGISLAQNSVLAGTTVAGTVTLNAPAKAGGFAVSLASSGSFVTVPSSVVVPAGQVSADFSAQTASTGSTNIVASANGVSRSALLIVNSVSGPSIATLTLSNSAISGGTSLTGTVTLNGAAQGSGALILLSADSTVVQVPASVTVPFGQTSAQFTIPTSAVTTTQKIAITAAYASVSKSATLSVNPVFALALSADSVIGATSVTGTVTLGSAATSTTLVTLASSDMLTAHLSSTMVSVPVGQTSATFTITTSTVVSARTVTITATFGSVSQTAPLTVAPAGTATLASVTVSPASVKGGTAVTGTVTLSTAAIGPSGVTITLQSSNKLAAQVPATLSIASGQSSAQFRITTISVTTQQTVTITASTGGSSKIATLTVQ